MVIRNNKNYYEILSVTPDSECDEVKSSYRRLARKYHPDVNKDNPECVQIFKDILEAYETLCDDEKRRKYDILNGFFKTVKTKTSSAKAQEEYKAKTDSGNATEPQKAEPARKPKTENTSKKVDDSGKNYENINKKAAEKTKKQQPKMGAEETVRKKFTDVFSDILDGISYTKKAPQKQKKEEPKRGSDIYTDISITMEEAVNGSFRTVNILHSEQCPSCNGRKFINDAHCAYCDGIGEHSVHRKISVKIPADVKSGNKLRISGEGNPGLNGGKNGDLYLKITINGNSKIQYEGLNILLSLPITPFEAALGGNISVPSIDGNILLKIPPSTTSGQKFRLSNQGLKKNNNVGDMIVTVTIQIPKKLSDDELRLYEKLQRMSTENIRENLLNE